MFFDDYHNIGDDPSRTGSPDEGPDNSAYIDREVERRVKIADHRNDALYEIRSEDDDGTTNEMLMILLDLSSDRHREARGYFETKIREIIEADVERESSIDYSE